MLFVEQNVSKIKEAIVAFWKNLVQNTSTCWLYIVGITSVISAFLFYLLSTKQDEIAALKAQMANLTTQKQADVLEAQVQQKLAEAQLSAQEIAQYQKVLDDLAAKRKELDTTPNSLTPQQIVDYWNKQ